MAAMLFRYIVDVLQCVAVCCSVLQCVAVCYSVLQCAAVCCSVLQCVASERIQKGPENPSGNLVSRFSKTKTVGPQSRASIIVNLANTASIAKMYVPFT